MVTNAMSANKTDIYYCDSTCKVLLPYSFVLTISSWSLLQFRKIAVCDQMATGVFLFFGSKDTKSAETIESFTRKFHVPYVCPCLTKVVDPTNNFQIHMKPPFTMAIVDMIRYYRWRNMIYLYDSTEGEYFAGCMKRKKKNNKTRLFWLVRF